MPPNVVDPKGLLYFKHIQTKALTVTNDDNTSSVKLTADNGKFLLTQVTPGSDLASSPAVIFENDTVSLRSGSNVISVGATEVTGVGSGGGGGPATLGEVGTGNTKYRFIVNSNDELELQKWTMGVYEKTINLFF